MKPPDNNELFGRGLTVFEFKKKYPRLFRKIKKEYKPFDNLAAICLWLIGEPPPTCELCGKRLTVSNKLLFQIDPPTKKLKRARCISHAQTDVVPVELINNVAQQRNLQVIHVDQFPHQSRSATITLFCQTHDRTFKQSVGYFIDGGGCLNCSSAQKAPPVSFEEWLKRSTEIHNGKYNYSLSETEFTFLKNDVPIICPTHGVFRQDAGVHSRGHGCPECGLDVLSVKKRTDTNHFIKRAKEKHGDRYDYSKTKYTTAHSHVTIVCPTHGEFTQVAHYHTAGNGCQACGSIKNVSSHELEIVEFLKSNNVKNIKPSWRGLTFEIDIFLPDCKLGIEFDGIYYHSSQSVDDDDRLSKYHKHKTDVCFRENIHLFHVFENEWIDLVRKEIWKSIILNKAGIHRKIHAKETNIVHIADVSVANEFFARTNLKGSINNVCVSRLNFIGLEVNGELVVLAGFNKKEDQTSYELIRFSYELQTLVIGGLNKIVDEFKKLYSPRKLYACADRRWETRDLFEDCGFTLIKTTDPLYYYIRGKNVFRIEEFQKTEQISFDESLTEQENMYNNKYRRIWDSGHDIFELFFN